MLIHMARHRGSKHTTPSSAQVVNRYSQLRELYRGYADGKLNLVLVLGSPGLGKGVGLKTALVGKGGLYVKGHRTHMKFYMELYQHKDKPVAIDDADSFLANKQLRELIKHLTETDQYKKIDYGTTSKRLADEGIPGHFYTTSGCAIVCNSWDSDDPICQAIESRAEVIHFTPDWAEVYREIGTWFWDQEIYDYLWEKLPFLKQPDMRLVKRAYDRKKSKLKELPWQEVIDTHTDDKENLLLRTLLAQATDGRKKAASASKAKRATEPKRQPTEPRKPTQKRAVRQKEPPKDEPKPGKTMGDIVREWCQATGLDQATFYRRKAEIEAWGGLEQPEKIKLTRTKPPEEERPNDGYVPGVDEEDNDEESEESQEGSEE
jgi:hypothetical protein